MIIKPFLTLMKRENQIHLIIDKWGTDYQKYFRNIDYKINYKFMPLNNLIHKYITRNSAFTLNQEK